MVQTNFKAWQVSKKNVFFIVITNFGSMFHLYTPWKRQKTFGFLTFSGGIEMEHWPEMG